MKALVLGGTKFLGRHLVDALLAHQHEVTTFTRGAHDEVIPAGVERLTGDRDGNLTALKGKRWDVVIDTSGFAPRIVRASADLLQNAADFYVFVSTVSVYRDWPKVVGIDEQSAVATLPDPTVEEPGPEAYGPLKFLCEQEVEQAFAGRSAIVRPGLIVGPYDPTNRFTYWPDRVAQGGETLAPAPPTRPAQFIDARDLADWIVRLAEEKRTGVYNAVGPDRPLALAELLHEADQISGSGATVTWVSDAFLQEQGVGEWMELPLWAPEDDAPGLSTVSSQKALDAGLTFRPLAETLRATLAWRATLPRDQEWPAGLKREREKELLAAWHARPQG